MPIIGDGEMQPPQPYGRVVRDHIRVILDSALDAFVLCDEAGVIMEWNVPAAAMFGYQRQEAVGQELSDLIIPKSLREAHRAGLRHYLATGVGPMLDQRVELSALRRDGTEFPVELSISALRQNGDVLFCGFIRDITDWRIEQQQHERDERQARIQQLIDTLTTSITFDEAMQGCLDAICEITGWPAGHVYLVDERRQRMVPTNDWHVRSEDDFSALRDVTSRMTFARGEGLPGTVWQRGEATWIHDAVNDPIFRRARMGVQVDVRGALGFPVKRDNKVVAMFEFFHTEPIDPDPQLATLVERVGQRLGEVIHRRQWEEDRARLAAIVQSSPDAIIGKSLDGTILHWNRGAERVYGYTAEEVVGQPIRIIIPQNDDTEEDQVLKALKSGERFSSFETVRRRKDGGLIDVSITVSPLRDGRGRILGTATIERDITRRKQIESDLREARDEAERANRTKSEFLANVSHELRTPMNAILGLTELSLQEDLSPTLRDYLETVHDSGETLLALLNDILDFSRTESGRFELEPEPFDPRDVCDDTMKVLSLRAQEKGLTLSCDVHEDVPACVEGDPRRVRQILLNLVSNAIKFTEHGEVIVQLGVDERDDEYVVIHATVRDTGAGIAEDDLEAIFAPFVQADASSARQHGGVGLGLAICRELTELMSGRMWAESRIGAGSDFHFTARFAIVEPADRGKPDAVMHRARTTQMTAPPRPLRVLLAEDTPANQKVVRAILERRGHRITVVANGQQAIAKHRDDDFDVVLMDVQMPGMDGFDATRAIRQHGEETNASVPIIAMTAHAMKDDEQRCLAAGMNGYIAKPIRARQLIYLVEQFAQQHLARANTLAKPRESEGTAVADLDEALRLLAGDDALLTDMIGYFLADAPPLLATMRSALESDDANAAARAAHSLAGLAAGLGAARVRDVARAIERAANSSDVKAASEQLPSLTERLNELTAFLERRRRGE